jgi:hypothetical protein
MCRRHEKEQEYETATVQPYCRHVKPLWPIEWGERGCLKTLAGLNASFRASVSDPHLKMAHVFAREVAIPRIVEVLANRH